MSKKEHGQELEVSKVCTTRKQQSHLGCGAQFGRNVVQRKEMVA